MSEGIPPGWQMHVRRGFDYYTRNGHDYPRVFDVRDMDMSTTGAKWEMSTTGDSPDRWVAIPDSCTTLEERLAWALTYMELR